MLEIVDGYCRDFKVKFGGDKSKVMVMNGDVTERDRESNVGEVKIGRTKEYKYLGCMLSEDRCARAKAVSYVLSSLALLVGEFDNGTSVSRTAAMSWLFGGGSNSSSDSSSSPSSFESDSSHQSFSDSSFGDNSGSLDADNANMKEMLQMEETRATFNSTVHKINNQCWEICMKSERLSESLSSRNKQCISDCCNRYVDSSLYVTNRFAQLIQNSSMR
ncbi:Tim10-like [Trinorchestia longiramus]|nr:Tim10-like [Trinorchestia longiramus]